MNRVDAVIKRTEHVQSSLMMLMGKAHNSVNVITANSATITFIDSVILYIYSILFRMSLNSELNYLIHASQPVPLRRI